MWTAACIAQAFHVPVELPKGRVAAFGFVGYVVATLGVVLYVVDPPRGHVHRSGAFAFLRDNSASTFPILCLVSWEGSCFLQTRDATAVIILCKILLVVTFGQNYVYEGHYPNWFIHDVIAHQLSGECPLIL